MSHPLPPVRLDGVVTQLTQLEANTHSVCHHLQMAASQLIRYRGVQVSSCEQP